MARSSGGETIQDLMPRLKRSLGPLESFFVGVVDLSEALGSWSLESCEDLIPKLKAKPWPRGRWGSAREQDLMAELKQKP